MNEVYTENNQVVDRQLYECYAKHTDSNHFLGIFSGDYNDIKAYCDENHKSYGTEIKRVNIKRVPAGYAVRLEELHATQAKLEKELAEVKRQINAGTA